MNEQETILLESFCGDLGLEIVFAGRGRVTLSSYSVYLPGLQLAGFFKYFDYFIQTFIRIHKYSLSCLRIFAHLSEYGMIFFNPASHA